MTIHAQHSTTPQPANADTARANAELCAASAHAERQRAVQDFVKFLARLAARQILEERRTAIRQLPEVAMCNADSSGFLFTQP